jgi:hypothetical protein
MKTSITILLLGSLLLLASCNNENKKAVTTSIKTAKTLKPEKKSQSSDKNKIRSQQVNYDQLLTIENKNCAFISSEILANILKVPNENITQGNNECTYFLNELSENNTRFYFKVESWGKKTILKNIKEAKNNAEMFGKDSKLSQYRLSDTGDTYLSMHQNRMVRILNEKSDVAIIILYFPKIAPDENDIKKINEVKEVAREQTYTIANSLLTKYQTK